MGRITAGAVPVAGRTTHAVREGRVTNQWNKILDVIKWDADRDSKDKNKYAWYRAHDGKKK